MRRKVAVALVLSGALWCSEVLAVNSVEVVPRVVITGQMGAEIGVHLTNDVTLQAFEVPLEFREITPGAYITGLSMSFGVRVPTSASSISLLNQYEDPTGSCNARGGYETSAYNDGLHHPVLASPEGVLAAWIPLNPAGYISPGADTAGSIILSVDVGTTPGQFEIDTTCIMPQNHLMFYDGTMPITPSFTKGTITIRGNNPPTAVCTDVTVYADQNCSADAFIDGGSSDPDGDALTFSQDPPGPYGPGQTTVTLTVSDGFGGSAQCMGIVTVADTIPPTVACASDVTVKSDCGIDGAVVVFADAIATDNCPGVTIVCDPPSGSMFPLGANTVTCTATDAGGNTAVCSFTITVMPNSGSVLCNANPGDVNCDGVENVLDIVLVVNNVFRDGGGTLVPCCFD